MRDLNVVCECPMCGAVRQVMVRSEDYVAWQNGKLIQQAFPYLGLTDREALMTGICGSCWREIFREEEE